MHSILEKIFYVVAFASGCCVIFSVTVMGFNFWRHWKFIRPRRNATDWRKNYDRWLSDIRADVARARSREDRDQ